MSAFLVQFDLDAVSERLSRRLGSRIAADDVREILTRAGLVESRRGWLAPDLRPLMLLYAGRPMFGR
ncbi:MAG: hypothetical protein D6744_08015 [Planctomycetota bacterium]|nr:MAG: hypothetical protein D6744_08015 [Planctomycetota bacterium]